MISKPTNYDSINENGLSRKLPMGGYVCIIRKVTDVTDKQYLEIEYDVYEGEYKNIAVDTYEAWGRWNHTFRVYYTEKSLWRLKKFISRLEATNPGFSFDWGNPQCIVNKGIGLIIGYREYYSSKEKLTDEHQDALETMFSDHTILANAGKEVLAEYKRLFQREKELDELARTYGTVTYQNQTIPLCAKPRMRMNAVTGKPEFFSTAVDITSKEYTVVWKCLQNFSPEVSDGSFEDGIDLNSAIVTPYKARGLKEDELSSLMGF